MSIHTDELRNWVIGSLIKITKSIQSKHDGGFSNSSSIQSKLALAFSQNSKYDDQVKPENTLDYGSIKTKDLECLSYRFYSKENETREDKSKIHNSIHTTNQKLHRQNKGLKEPRIQPSIAILELNF